ncbi:MAG: YbjQ family protein [Methylobacteriaceae bacterium]|nr:YbjQ family protein [Methylobacteriaceae bacterium]MBV9703398.1 YbjQ family protein [Methylobacteriaceae bacterium]
MIVTTTNDVSGYRITRHLGICRGITVRSRSVIGNVVGGLQSIFGGQLSAYTHLAETARQEAFDLMVEHAGQAGANAVVGMRYDANEIMDGITEVLAYGTAVVVEAAPGTNPSGA